jgi:hypothetical protein
MINFFGETIAADPARAGRIGYYAVTVKGPGPGTVKADETSVEDTAGAGEPDAEPGPESGDEEGVA